jgi:hypothetical protein
MNAYRIAKSKNVCVGPLLEWHFERVIKSMYRKLTNPATFTYDFIKHTFKFALQYEVVNKFGVICI